jgi:hypothetical protein
MNHVRILYAYLSRLTNDELETILAIKKDWLHASMNLGTLHQLQCQHDLGNAIHDAMENMLVSDIEIISRVITEEIDHANHN